LFSSEIGLAFLGRAYSEADLLAFGYAFEQRTKARTAPTFPPTLAARTAP
jgi:amidase